MKSNRYLDIIDGKNIVIKTPNGFDSQVWWFDQKSKTIKSLKYKDKSLDIEGAGKSGNMNVWQTNSRWWQVFKYSGENFKNIANNKVLDVQGGRDSEG